MRTPRTLAALGGVACLLTVQADWDIGDEAKWVQLPDLNGYNVLSVRGGFYPSGLPVTKVVADDFLCTDPRPIVDIHVWGSWWQDQAGPGFMPFTLTIWTDVPAGSDPNVPWSHPGELLWSRMLMPTSTRVWGTGDETFFDPNGILPPSPEHVIWQYNFDLATEDYFEQEVGKIYWLSVAAMPPAGLLWGWKTSLEQWNDDATWTDLPDARWEELVIADKSRDMAFVLTVPEPGVLLGALFVLGWAGARACFRRT